MHRLLLALSLVLGACSGDSPTPTPDAGGPAAGGFGASCMAVTDTSSECMNKPCTNTFDMVGHPVCSQLCTFGMDASCPAGAMGAKCNMRGYCRP
jgi:hypothetical protein